MKRGSILESGSIRWYERVDVGKNQYSTVAKSWTMDQECYHVCTTFLCSFCVYHTPDGSKYAPFDVPWRSVQLHKTAGLKRHPKLWFGSLHDMLAAQQQEPEPPEEIPMAPVEEPPNIFEEE